MNYGAADSVGQPATTFGELWDNTMVQQAAGEAPDNPKLTISRQQLRTTVACSTSDSLVDVEEDFGQSNTLNFQ